IHLAILCEYSSVFVLVIVWLDYLSAYIPDFTHFTLHSHDWQTVGIPKQEYSTYPDSYCW
ncbi:hypothetical protein, partial [Pseudanabaena sp. FACHB-1998]|uniref:hypothetical protein n=1 Tax=Pseudanabaena sp. FACHB-1998 TaxID=2692858 RepID=UPI001A7E8536